MILMEKNMARLTISFDDGDHLALKLLSLKTKIPMGEHMQNALHAYLIHNKAYDLEIQQKQEQD
jgi:hypothetical protein